MKFSTNSKALSKALDSVSAALPLRHQMPIMNTILFEQEQDGMLRLTASDLNTTITDRLGVNFHSPPKDPPWRVAVPATYLVKTMQSLGDIPVTFEVNEHYAVTLSTDAGAYTISGLDGGDYPASPVLKVSEPQVMIDRALLMKGIGIASFAVATKEGAKTAMGGILLSLRESHVRVVGTDSLRLVLFKCLGVKCSEELSPVLPITVLKGLRSISGGDVCSVFIDRQQVAFDFGSARLVTRIIDAPFPQYERVLPKHNDRKLLVSREQLWSAVRRISLFSGPNAPQVFLDMTPDTLTIRAQDVERSPLGAGIHPVRVQGPG